MNFAVAGVTVIVAVLLAACGAEAGGATTSGPLQGGGPVAGACPQDDPECVDTPDLENGEPVAIDETGVNQLRRDAKFYLGKRRSQLNETIRIGRIGNEHFPLTEDYVVGRITVALDEVDGDEIVTSATVELPDGPETFNLDE